MWVSITVIGLTVIGFERNMGLLYYLCTGCTNILTASWSNATETNANEGTEKDTNSDDGNDDESQQDINAVLATAMNLVTNNNVVHDYIANTINPSTEGQSLLLYKIAILLFYSRLLSILHVQPVLLCILKFMLYTLYLTKTSKVKSNTK